MNKPIECPKCGSRSTNYIKEELIAKPGSINTRRLIPFLIIAIIILITPIVIFNYYEKGNPQIYLFIAGIIILTLLGIDRNKKSIPVGTIFHYSCDTCAHKWDISGMQKYFLDKGQMEEAEKGKLGETRRPDKNGD